MRPSRAGGFARKPHERPPQCIYDHSFRPTDSMTIRLDARTAETPLSIRNSYTALVAAVALLWATTAGAATYFVSPTGSSANSGSPAAPWTLGKANSALTAGDVAILLPGNYGTTNIAPAASGTSYSKFITYVGALANPASTIINGVTFGTRQFVSVKGVQLGSTVTFGAAHDSLSWCTSPTGAVAVVLGGDDCVVANSTFNSDRVWLEGGTNSSSPPLVSRDTLYNCTFNLYLNGYGPTIRINAVSELYIRRCRFIATVGPEGDHGTFKIYGGRNCQFIDSYFDFTNNRTTACDECGLGYFRDYTTHAVFKGDTIIHRAGAGPMNEMLLSASGTWPGTTIGNRYEDCLFIQEQWVSTGALYWQDSARGDTILNCVVISAAAQPIEMSGLTGNCVVSHNSFIYLGTTGHAANAGYLYEWGGAASVKDNIFYSPNSPAPSYLVTPAVVSSGNYTGDRNLLYNGKGASTSLSWNNRTTSPGSGGAACTGNGEECTSLYGNPLLAGGSGVFGFSASLTAGSPAIGAASDGGDIGAVPFGGSSTDVLAPLAIANLSIVQTTDNSVVLGWMATGDDGSVGRAAIYDIRISNAPITAANFLTASQLSNILIPKPSGQSEQFVAGGLSSATAYYFAIQAIDDAGNRSSISNIASTTTSGSDTIPPGQIIDLNAGP